MGDIWAMGGKPQAALASITLPRMSGHLQTRTLREIMQGASNVFRAAGADIVGGHSSVGAELNIGFTVTGLVDGSPITHAGALSGDALILTKPIGTGVLAAAEMQKKARGTWIAEAWAHMLQPQSDAAAELAPFAHAMTDITGFGLAGHLLNMLEASSARATLYLDKIPVFDGAEELAQQGIRSWIWSANRKAVAANLETSFTAGKLDLLFDPQTAGGLLAAIPADKADACMTALTDKGYSAAVIGEVTRGTSAITVA
ncbi:MAG: selenide, water dikinase SelD, partial [Methyloligellaceae bacterium]